MKGYPSSFKLMLYGVALAVLISGILLVPTMLDLRLEWDMPWRLPLAGRTAAVAAHLGAALWLMMLFGAAWTVHMRLGWRAKHNLVSGLFIVGLMLVLALSSVGIYYLGDEDLSLWASLIHTVIGLSLPLMFVYHITLGKRRADAAAERDHQKKLKLWRRPKGTFAAAKKHRARRRDRVAEMNEG